MLRCHDIDYGFRPENYWDEQDPLQAVLRNVKGRARREMIADYWRSGRIQELEDEILKDELRDDQRQSFGAIHPFFMGGEYLPSYRPGEVAIVRIELKSTTYDVIELRGRPHPEGIELRVVDEYETEYVLPAKVVPKPFSLEELIEFLAGTHHARAEQGDPGFPLCFSQNIVEWGADLEDARSFTSVTSEFYADLRAHFGGVFEEWYQTLKREEEEEMEADDDEDGD